MITGIGEPGDWNGQHFRSPTVLDFGDYLLLAMEGWPDDHKASGIGLMIGVETWLQAKEDSLVLNSQDNSSTKSAKAYVGNYGAGTLTITDIRVAGPGYRIVHPGLPYQLLSSDEIEITVSHSGEMSQMQDGVLVVESNALLGSSVVIQLSVDGD